MAEDKLRREQVGVPEKDELAKDLLNLLSTNGLDVKSKEVTGFMTEVVPYIVRRDHKIFNHAYNVGRSSA